MVRGIATRSSKRQKKQINHIDKLVRKWKVLKQKVRLDYPSHLNFACIKCGKCCGDTREKTRHIVFLKIEAEVISKKIQQPIYKFSIPIEGKAPYVFEMKKNNDGKCLFLNANRCTIYSERPLVCRFFPFELRCQQENTLSFLSTEECPGINKGPELDDAFFEKLFKLAYSRTRENSEKIQLMKNISQEF